MDPGFIYRNRREKLLVVEHWWTEQKGRCHYCGHPMKPYHRQKSDDGDCASIEHLRPKRDGGPNSVENTRLAHKRCNNAVNTIYEYNVNRALMGLPPIPVSWAIENAVALTNRPFGQPRLRYMDGDANPFVPTVVSGREPGEVRYSAAQTVPVGGLPRGATLPGYVPPDDDPPPRQPAPVPRAALLDRTAAPVMPIRRPVCVECGGHDVVRDATVRWDWAAGWQIAERLYGWECRTCQIEVLVRWEGGPPVP